MAAAAARLIGALRTVIIGEGAGLAGYWALFLLGHFSLRGVGGFMIGRYSVSLGWLVPVVVARGGS